ncbi:helix-turn-helix domain-containing protein [Paracoccus denitrificans]|jgi:transcriptional regulator with XRE-family HTH domain|uniref:Transcriptional regulator, XRE family n=1 Tax=Paracoccus denitrificans (strain Pd 1222) TaxID=318586 RepID=A1B8R9_PARDP|nr:helix-turn-helix transcriptional regulator [Paracoccus denitrificans]ABL71913.1 transcriptional regulator, XRE family [Paracoccus denitrificans PD1222]MBB4626183.1 transcriptional regulator with XRE-family HTH domain [Paracoccus denitrificans]MCU7430629.1 helix-turn-helix domain-containing protein [Paracoccus denitrificans]QAR28498.1 XRE family transcriptional regulator [Paracoccus denitrificans]UPV96641.1 helix-turn-helix domain-containing protein [Paracoccus denitrificans]
MKQDNHTHFDFGDDENEEDESYLLCNETHVPGTTRPSSRPLGRLLKDVRKSLKLTQAKMAALMGVSLRSYKGYEGQEVRKVPATALQLLAKRTNISAASLLTGWSAPLIDYDAIVGEVLSLQSTIWGMCQRPDGHSFGMSTGLNPRDALFVATGLLTNRDRLRREQGNPDLQVTQRDIREAIEEWTDYNRVADWEWERVNDPTYYGLAPFPCPAMYVLPEFADMADYRRYSQLRNEIYKALNEQDRARYRDCFRRLSAENPKY